MAMGGGGGRTHSFVFSFKLVLVKSALACSSVTENDAFCSTLCLGLVTTRAQGSIALGGSDYNMSSSVRAL